MVNPFRSLAAAAAAVGVVNFFGVLTPQCTPEVVDLGAVHYIGGGGGVVFFQSQVVFRKQTLKKTSGMVFDEICLEELLLRYLVLGSVGVSWFVCIATIPWIIS